MKAVFIFLIACTFSPGLFAQGCEKMTEVRNQFHKARSEKTVASFLSFAKKISCTKATPYVATATMRQAEFVNSPIQKLRYFKKGKAVLEQYIDQHPTDIEARYVRILVQKNIPSLLGYSSDIESDQKYIRAHIDHSNLSASYKKTILKYIKI